MNLQVYAPNVHLFAFHLYKTPSTDSNSATQATQNLNYLKDKCDEIFQELGVSQKLNLRNDNPVGLRVNLLNTAKDNGVSSLIFEKLVFLESEPATPVKIAGFAYPLRIDDSCALALNIRRPEKEDDDKTNTKDVDIALLKKFNPGYCLLPDFVDSSLGQTLVITAWLTEEQKKQQDGKFLKELANQCLQAFILDPQKQPKFYRGGKLFGSPIFEYGLLSQPGTYRHILVCFFCNEATAKRLERCYHNLLDLFFYRNKIIRAFQDSRELYEKTYREYEKIEQLINNTFKQLPQENTLSEADLKNLKTQLKTMPQMALEYARLLRYLESKRNTIVLNTQNYQEKLKQIRVQLQSHPEYPCDPDLSFLETFHQEDSPHFQGQIQGDLGYFVHGSGLLEKAIASIRGIVEIDQAERDRESQKALKKKDDDEKQANLLREANEKERDHKLQNTLEAVGAGIAAGLGAGEISTASYNLVVESEDPIRWWPSTFPPKPHPVTIFLVFSVLVGLGVGFLTWGVIRLVQRRNDEFPVLQALPDLLETKPDLFSTEDLRHLDQTLEPLENNSLENTDKILRNWCKAHQAIWKELGKIRPFQHNQSARTSNSLQDLRQQVKNKLNLLKSKQVQTPDSDNTNAP